MKKYGWVVLLAAALFVPVTAQAQTCFWTMCDWLDEDFEDNTLSDWNPVYATIENINDSCYSGAANKVVEIQNGGSISKSFYVDGQVSSGTTFELDFRMTIVNDNNSYWDALTVRVINDDTAASEVFYFRSDSYGSSCSDLSVPLSGNYKDHNVTVEFEVYYLSQTAFQLDQISFWQN